MARPTWAPQLLSGVRRPRDRLAYSTYGGVSQERMAILTSRQRHRKGVKVMVDNYNDGAGVGRPGSGTLGGGATPACQRQRPGTWCAPAVSVAGGDEIPV